LTERDVLIDALQESEKKYRISFEHSTDAIILSDPQDGGKILSTNPAACQMLGWLEDELIGKRRDVLFDLEDPKVSDVLDELMHSGSAKAQLTYKRKDETTFPGELSTALFMDSNGEPRIVNVIRDITERKKAHDTLEEKVEKSTSELERAYKALVENDRRLSEAQKMAHIGIWDWNLVTDEMYWSDEIYHILGYDPQKSASSYNNILNRTHPDDRYNVDSAVKKASKGCPFDIDHRIILTGGEERIVHAQGEVICDDKNNPVRMRGTVQDITDRIRVEEQIKTLANIVESSNDAIGTMYLDGIITSWNPGAEHIFGYTVEEILGKPISILAPPHLEKETIKLIEEIKQGKNVQRYETLRLRKDGMPIYVSITLSPVFDTSGKLTAVSFISRDITERKEAEKALKNFEIARKKEIHHRIKNNLQVIYSLLDLQAEKFKGKKNIRDSEVLNAFTESQDRVLSIALIHEELYKGKNIDVLNFSQYIKELTENLLLTYRLKTDISLNLDLEENIFYDLDTAIPLGIIVNELFSNSLKYAFQGRTNGKIQIKLCRDETEESGRYSCKSNFLLRVADDGIGIPENFNIEELDSLGMQLVTTLVDQLDGEFELIKNNGTEFNIKFTLTEKDNLT
jgi:PAS domain S-box-containing protein